MSKYDINIEVQTLIGPSIISNLTKQSYRSFWSWNNPHEFLLTMMNMGPVSIHQPSDIFRNFYPGFFSLLVLPFLVELLCWIKELHLQIHLLVELLKRMKTINICKWLLLWQTEPVEPVYIHSYGISKWIFSIITKRIYQTWLELGNSWFIWFIYNHSFIQQILFISMHTFCLDPQ